jgi:glycosyltransferase involved in cell wall biosynthesis
MRMLLVSNFTTASAYAKQAQLLASHSQALGHDVTVLDIRPGSGTTAQIGDVRVLPMFNDPLGSDSIPAHAERSQADAVITLVDVWGLSPDVMHLVNWWPIVPVDHTPVPPGVVNSLQAAKGAIALSRFGQAELRKIGIEALYMPHGVQPDIWYPALTRADMQRARAAVKLPPDGFIVSFVGVNDSNPSRKGIPELLAAWSMLHRKYPNWYLYLHTTLLGNIPLAGQKNGVDVSCIVKTFGVDPASLIMPDEYRLRTGIPASELATLVRGSDVFILPTRGEGFGVPLIEAQHAGTPVITTDFATGPELCASGWLIDGECEWSYQGSTVLRPGIASIADRLEQAYAERGNLARRFEAAEFARDFEIDRVAAKYLAPVLTQIAEQTVLAQKVTV